MKLVKHILDSKGTDIWCVSPEDSVLEAIKIMADKRIGALLVIDQEKLTGIVSERDYARKVILKGRSSESTKVREIMTSDLICTNPEDSVEDCMSLMTKNHIRHLPIIKDTKVVGILSIGDLVKSIIEEQDYTIKQLEMYITG